jgi:hypothetical protein
LHFSQKTIRLSSKLSPSKHIQQDLVRVKVRVRARARVRVRIRVRVRVRARVGNTHVVNLVAFG